jgi:L-ascorbate metabolism protein UlaG (beta-lactamase superfamily)
VPSVEVTWWGHSTVSLRDSGTHLLTDPVLTHRVAHLTRRRGTVPPMLAPDAVLVSHLHHDHLHLPSLRRLPPGTAVLVPAGGGGLLDDLDLVVTQVEPGDTLDVAGVQVRAVRAWHDGRRHPGSSWSAPALGYVVEGTARTWFAGDTGPDVDLGADVGEVDVALVPVGGWGPVSRSSVRGEHLGPVDAAETVQRVGAALAVPIHYGTMWPSGMRARVSPAFAGPGAHFAALAPGARQLAPGQSLTWPIS